MTDFVLIITEAGLEKEDGLPEVMRGSTSSSPLEADRLPEVRPKMFTEEELLGILRQLRPPRGHTRRQRGRTSRGTLCFPRGGPPRVS